MVDPGPHTNIRPKSNDDSGASLDKMPVEIFKYITDYLDFNTICNLRRVSRVMDHLCISRFGETLWTKMTETSIWEYRLVDPEDTRVRMYEGEGKPGAMKVLSSPSVLQHMRMTPKIREFATKIKKIVVVVYIGADEEGREYFRNLVRNADLYKDPEWHRKRGEAYERQIQYQERRIAAIHSYSDAGCFQEALETMENLEEVDVKDVMIWEGTPNVPESYYSATAMSNEVTKIASIIMTAMARVKNQISSLNFGSLLLENFMANVCGSDCVCDVSKWANKMGSCRLSAFDISELRQTDSLPTPVVFHSLCSLHATISSMKDCRPGENESEDTRAFGRFLQACPNLRKLSLDALTRWECGECGPEHRSFHPQAFFFPPSFILGLTRILQCLQLKALGLADFVTTPGDFGTLLDSQKGSIRTLEIKSGHLLDGQWAFCYKKLLDDFNLKDLHLGPLFQLHPDQYKRSGLFYDSDDDDFYHIHDRYPVDSWDAKKDIGPREALSLLLEREWFDIGDYPILADNLNDAVDGTPMYCFDSNTLSPLVRHFAEDHFGIDTTYDLSWLFELEMVESVKRWEEEDGPIYLE
ncbi:hypothetical protein HDK64DRAFT_295950 [Phyllosticta capitalensis]